MSASLFLDAAGGAVGVLATLRLRQHGLALGLCCSTAAATALGVVAAGSLGITRFVAGDLPWLPGTLPAVAAAWATLGLLLSAWAVPKLLDANISKEDALGLAFAAWPAALLTIAAGRLADSGL